MRRAAAFVTVWMLTAATVAVAQSAAREGVKVPATWLQGFSRAVSGETISYPWAYPGQMGALLARATDGTRRVEWDGEAAAPGPDAERVTYVWHAGLASGYGAHRFTLSVNGTQCATFRSGRNTGDRAWRFDGGHGCTLAFQATRVGTFNELFGLMMLTVPRASLGAGPPRFAVVGDAAGSQDYYMTFQAPVSAWARPRAEQARVRGGRRLVRLEVSHVGEPAPFTVRSNGQALATGTLALGYNTIALEVERGLTALPIALEVGGRDVPVEPETPALAPVRAWEIHLLPHSHVDIGYSDPQPVVERKQWKNLGDAVALAAKTAAYPTEARFRWNVEGLWSVESYLAQASDQERGAFVAAVRAGSIGLQANYTNILTGLCTPEELAHWTDAARRLAARYGLPIGRTAMHTDIPGLSWPVVRALAQAGVRYFTSGPNYMPSNPDLGDRIGFTLKALGDKPFWWTSPSGEERLLFWMAGRGYSLFHGMNSGPISASGPQTLFDYLRDLNASDYPYEMVQVRYTVGGDNGPVDPALPDFVKTWNDTYESPRLVIDTADAMFEEFERRYGKALPARGGDMTPYWEDGAISTAAEEATVRAASRRLQQAQTVWAIRNPRGFPAARFEDAWSQVLLWHEHTWGAADSISQPDRKDVVDQWEYKRRFALESDRLSKALLAEALAAKVVGDRMGPRLDTRSGALAVQRRQDASSGRRTTAAFDVTNTASWSRGEVVMLPAAATTGLDHAVNEEGKTLPSQRLSDGRLAVFVNVQPLAATRVILAAGPAAAPVFVPVTISPDGTSLRTGGLRADVDPATGDIRQLTACCPTRDLVQSGEGVGRYLFVAGRDPSTAVSAGRPDIRVEESGPLVASVRISSTAPGTTSIVRRITLVAGSDHVELEAVIDKPMNRDKESAHLAFPFDIPDGVVRVAQGEAMVTMGRDQLPGSCVDFIGVSDTIAVFNDRGVGVSIASFDAPLFEPGAITDERPAGPGLPRAWRQTPSGGTVYAYLFNNYWHTNYKADQSGRLIYRFLIEPHVVSGDDNLRRRSDDVLLSWKVEHPLLVSDADGDSPVSSLLFILTINLSAENLGTSVEAPWVVASSVKPLEDGAVLFRLYNPSVRRARVELRSTRSGKVTRARAFVSDISGHRGAALPQDWYLPPSGSILVRVEADVK